MSIISKTRIGLPASILGAVVHTIIDLTAGVSNSATAKLPYTQSIGAGICLSLLTNIMVGFGQYTSPYISSDKHFQYGLTAVECFFVVPIFAKYCNNNEVWDQIFSLTLKDVTTKLLVCSIITQSLALKYIWEQDDSINTELEIGQIAELEVSSELTTI